MLSSDYAALIIIKLALLPMLPMPEVLGVVIRGRGKQGFTKLIPGFKLHGLMVSKYLKIKAITSSWSYIDLSNLGVGAHTY